MVLSISKFIQVFIAIILGWTIVALTVMVVNNFAFQVLKLDSRSFKHTFWFTFILSVIFVTYVFLLPEDTNAPTEVVNRMMTVTSFDEEGTLINDPNFFQNT